MEAAGRRRVDRAGHVALQPDPLALRSPLEVRHRHGRQQRHRVRVHRRLVELLATADLHDLAEVHDRDPVADVPHDRQVVRDDHVGQPELVLQVLEQVDDLGLDRHVQGGDRLVRDDELRPQRQRPGDADALALTAGELVRVAVVVLGVEPDQLEQLLHRLLDAVLGLTSCSRYGAPTIAPTVCRGFSDPYGSWKIIWMSRRSGRIAGPTGG